MGEVGNQQYSLPVYKFGRGAEAILKAQKVYGGAERNYRFPNSNFLKGVKWSPDGACLVTASEDTRLRIYDLPEDALQRSAIGSSAERDQLSASPDNYSPALEIKEGETIFDYAWFPAMSASEPISCVLASTCRAHPVHLWDACDGSLRCTYRAYNAVDEVTAAYSLAFPPDGSRLFGGFNHAIRVWDTSRPGRDYKEILTYKKGTDGLPGIISCMAFNPNSSGLMAAGAYSGQAALFDSRTDELLFQLQGQKGGLTQVTFAPDGNFLFTGARADREVWCWDVRQNSGVVYKLERETPSTNQRIQFGIEPCGRHLATGGEDGKLSVFDLSVGRLVDAFPVADDTVNGFDFHPYLPLTATTSGQRRFLTESSSDSESEANGAERGRAPFPGTQNALMVWRFEHSWMTVAAANPTEVLEATGNESADQDMQESPSKMTEPQVIEEGELIDEETELNPTEAAGELAANPELKAAQGLSPQEGALGKMSEAKGAVRQSPETFAGLAAVPKLVPFGQELVGPHSHETS